MIGLDTKKPSIELGLDNQISKLDRWLKLRLSHAV